MQRQGRGLFVRTLLLAAALFLGLPAAAQPAVTDVQQFITQRAAPLRASGGAKLEAAPSHEAATLGFDEAIALFYGQRDDQPAWDDPKVRAALLDRLRELPADGLNPAHYHVDRIAAGPPPVDAQSRANYDWMVTHSAMLALLHLYRGKVDPATLDKDWNFTPRAIDPQASLQAFAAAVQSGDFRGLYAQARPQHWMYTRLRTALSWLRTMEAAGGWPAIPPGPALKPGADDPRVPALRRRLTMEGRGFIAEPGSTLYDEELQAAVKEWQAAQYLDADGVIGPGTLAMLNLPVTSRIAQLRANLERGRWLLHRGEGDFVLVDVAGYKIALYRDGKVAWESRAQVGQPYRSTPLFQSMINVVTLNPTWTVPPTVLTKDVLPKVRKDAGYLARNRIRVLDAGGRELPAASVNWNRPGNITLRQDAGPGNALGSAAIRFPNPYAVYLHDTPHQALFGKSQRDFSSGCIRVERALELVELLLDDPQRWSRAQIDAAVTTAKTENVRVARQVPILLAYWTVDIDKDDHPAFKPDIYARDPALIEALDRPPT